MVFRGERVMLHLHAPWFLPMPVRSVLFYFVVIPSIS